MEQLSIHKVSKAYQKGKLVVNDVSFAIKRGEIVAVVGHSGCGKTTLLRAIAGFESLNAGEIFIQDTLVSSATFHLPANKRKVGFVFQDWALFPHLNVAQNVAFGLPKTADREQKMLDFLDKVGLASFEKSYPNQLSGGQQQRVALARALVTQPDLLLLDEPFSNLDVALKAQMRKEIKTLITESQATALIVTHDMLDAFSLAQKVAVMQAGKLVQFDTPAIIYEQPVNEYVAKLSGKTNIIGIGEPLNAKLSQGTNKLLIRPEHIYLCNEGGLEATFIDTEFNGAHQLTHLNCMGTKLVIEHSYQVALPTNIFINFRLEKMVALANE